MTHSFEWESLLNTEQAEVKEQNDKQQINSRMSSQMHHPAEMAWEASVRGSSLYFFKNTYYCACVHSVVWKSGDSVLGVGSFFGLLKMWSLLQLLLFYVLYASWPVTFWTIPCPVSMDSVRSVGEPLHLTPWILWIKPRLSGLLPKCLYPLRPLEAHNSFFWRICHSSQEVTPCILSRALPAHQGYKGGGLSHFHIHQLPSSPSYIFLITWLIGFLVSFTMRVIVTCLLTRAAALIILIHILAVKLPAAPVNTSCFIGSLTFAHSL